MSELKFDLESTTTHTVANTTGIGRGNVGAVALRNFTVAIDSTFYANTAMLFRENLEKYFRLPVKYLILTHYHSDHIFGLGPFSDVVSICSEQMLRNMKSKAIKERYEQLLVDIPKEDPLADGLVFELPNIGFNDKIRIYDEDLYIDVYHLGGHTSGSSIVHVPHENVLFAGDLIFSNAFPYAGDATANPETYIKAFERMMKLEAETIIPGHGAVLKGKSSLDVYLQFFKDFRKVVLEGIKDNIKPEEIKVPTKFEVPYEELKTVSLNHWYNYYKNK
jgi:glyoxylase-like metal-dependent hydrolase (beta-lactamase superfamily II)